MIKKIKHLIGCLAILSLVIAVNTPTTVQAETDTVDVRQAFGLAMEQYGQFDQYEMTFKIENKDTNQVLLKGRLLHHVDEGNSILDMSVYDYQEEENQGDTQVDPTIHPFRMLTYGHQQLIYLNQMEWLSSLGVFDIAPINSSVQNEISRYQRHWVSVDSHQSANQEGWRRLFPLIETEIIRDMPAEAITYNHGAYRFNLERIEIPPNILSEWGQVQLNYIPKVALDTDQEETKWILYTQQNFAMDQRRSDIVVNLGATFDVVDFFSPPTSPINESVYDEMIAGLNREFTFSTRDVTQKMTEIDYYMHPKNQHLSVVINGIAERIDLNILGQQKNQLVSANYQLSIDVKPSNESIPPVTSIQRLTGSEFNYLLNQALNR